MTDAVYTPGPLNPVLDTSARVVGVDVLTGNTIRFRFPNGESYTVTLPDGAPGFPGTNGVTPTFSIGRVTSLPPGADPSVTVRSTDLASHYAIDFRVPAGPAGATPAFVPGTITMGPAGSQASGSFTPVPDSPNTYELDLTLPVGPTGSVGPAPTLVAGTFASGAFGSQPTGTVTPVNGAPGTYAINLTVPMGSPGPAGDGTGDVIGPALSKAGNLFAFADDSGTAAADSGVSPASLADDAFLNSLIFGA